MSEVTSAYNKTKIYSGSVDILAEDNFGRAEALLNGIPGGVYKAVGSALTRAASAGKTEAKRAVAQEYTIGSGDFLRHAFRANAGSHWGIYERVGAERFPIRQLYGPATTQMMYSNEEVLDAIEEKMAETFEKRIDHEILRVLNGWGA